MKSFWSLIPRNIFKSKKRVLFIGIGLILSTILIISLSIMLETLRKSSLQSMVDDAGGNFDLYFYSYGNKNIDNLYREPFIDKVSLSAKLGTYTPHDSKFTLEINGYEKNIEELVNFKLIQGRYPEKDNEIALEGWMLAYLPVKYNIGDKIKLTSSLEQPLQENKKEIIKVENEFVLVGLFDYKCNTNGDRNKATAYVTRDYVERTLSPESISYAGYITLKPDFSIGKGAQLLGMVDEYNKIFFKMNSIKSFVLHSFKSLQFICVILYLVICIIASIIIYNIFNVSITERTKEFGMFRAIGASPGDVKALVIGEGLALGFIFIPIGIFIGNITIKCIITLVSGYKDFNGIMSVPQSGIAASIIIGFLSIVMGIYSPAKRVASISPIEAISSNSNFSMEGSNIKQDLNKKNLFSRLWGFPANLAYVNLNRNRKRYLTTVFSLSISIVIFMLVNFLINSTDPISNLKKSMGGDFAITSSLSSGDYSISDRNISDIMSINGVTKLDIQKSLSNRIQVSQELITNEGMKFLKKESSKSPNARDEFEQKIYKFNANIMGYEEEALDSLKGYLKDGSIDTESMQQDPVIILAQNLNYTNNTKIKVGDKISIIYPCYDESGKYIKEKSELFTVGALLKEDYTTVDMMTNNLIIMSNSCAERYLSLQGYQQVKVQINKEASYEKVESSLKKIFDGHRGVTLKSYKEELQNARGKDRTLSLIMYSFVIIVGIVSIINLVNIMCMNVILRKREMGMLRAIGFGKDEVNLMIRIEGIYYGLNSAFFGVCAGTVLSYILYLISRKVLKEGMVWRFPFMIVGATFIITIAICLLSAISASRGAYTDNIVESIRTIE